MNEICKLAVDTYGKEAQLNQAFEEMAELMVTINHWRRGRAKEDDVLSEIADVAIMCEQLCYIVHGSETGICDCKKIVAQKLLHQEERIKEHIASANTQK